MKEEGAIVAASRVKREQEGGCANQAPDQRREQHRVDTSHRSTRQKKGDQFEPGRITAPDHHGFEGKPWKEPPLHPGRRRAHVKLPIPIAWGGMSKYFQFSKFFRGTDRKCSRCRLNQAKNTHSAALYVACPRFEENGVASWR